MKNALRETVYLKNYKPTPYQIKHVELKLELDPKETRVESRLFVEARPGSSAASLVLDGRELVFEAVAIDGRALSASEYQVDAESLTIFKLPDSCTVEVKNRINPSANLLLEGLYLSKGNFSTQCEAEGFRRITYFLDRPDVMASYRVTLIASNEAYPVLLSNGNCLDAGQLDDKRHYAVWDDPFPKPCYLFALVAGRFAKLADQYTTLQGRSIQLAIYAEARDIDKCYHAMASLKHAMRWDEEVYGLECDLDEYKIVAIGDFNMGAMENKGLNIFNTALVLAKPETATDDNFTSIEAVIGHEYFHNWTGNRVTCRDWFQLCLKEGFTVFRDQEFSSDMGSRAVRRIQEVEHLRMVQWPEDAGPMAHPPRPDRYIEINNFYTTTVYYKGAEVVRMLHTLIGPSLFRKGTDLYFAKYDGMAVTQENFVDAMAEASGRDLSQFMRWYTDAGTPTVTVSERFDAPSATYTLTFKQETPPTPGQATKEPRHIPLRLGLLRSDGGDEELRLAGEKSGQAHERLFELRQQEETLTFQGISKRPVPSLFRNFSAAVKLRFPYSASDLQFLMAHDQDPFNCWDAAQNLYIQTILALVEEKRLGQAFTLPQGVVDAFGVLLGNERFDPALKALALALPAEHLIAQHMAVVDPEAIYEAREFTRRAFALAHREALQKTYEGSIDRGQFSIAPPAVARRALKNRCLAYLGALEGDDIFALVHRQYREASNMTDTDRALALLVAWERPERAGILEDFYQRWRHDELVLDRWFAVQGSCRLLSTLDLVKSLLAHGDFNTANPNRVRSLLGSFCLHNPRLFHSAGGEGYRICADYVVRLDKSNRQMASHLARAFEQWRRYDAPRREAMCKHLTAILAEPKLSPDVYEVVSKALQA